MPRTFLDTNVAQALSSFGEFVYDGYVDARLKRQVQSKGPRFAEDLAALAAWAVISRRNGWPVFVSESVVREHDDTPHSETRCRLVDWDLQLMLYQTQSGPDTKVTTSKKALLEFLSERYLKCFPGLADRRLIADALAVACEVFLTMDYRTILSFRKQCQAPIDLMSPTELMAAAGVELVDANLLYVS